ncbi:MAG: 8-oxo-dGTP diphosphatase [Chitinivibrionales bacterium]|nr:8-oxo-dGTP diphosphatase [Chitinivibrionales bacterium]
MLFHCFFVAVPQAVSTGSGAAGFGWREGRIMEHYQSVTEVDWQQWQPKERAVLCFIQSADRLMLIHKKTGLGAGKINAPGGRIEAGESALQAAIRETQEEIGLIPANLVEMGQLFFIFTDGYSLHGTVFKSDQYSGSPIETDEAAPFWCPLNAIPYNAMWEDDRYWLPQVLAGNCIRGYFIFDGDIMLSRNVVVSGCSN